LGAANPEIAFQLKSQVQEHILDYLNQFKKGSLIGAVADPKPPMELAETTNPPKLERQRRHPERYEKWHYAYNSTFMAPT
jgi:hypothetical protein